MQKFASVEGVLGGPLKHERFLRERGLKALRLAGQGPDNNAEGFRMGWGKSIPHSGREYVIYKNISKRITQMFARRCLLCKPLTHDDLCM